MTAEFLLKTMQTETVEQNPYGRQERTSSPQLYAQGRPPSVSRSNDDFLDILRQITDGKAQNSSSL